VVFFAIAGCTKVTFRITLSSCYFLRLNLTSESILLSESSSSSFLSPPQHVILGCIEKQHEERRRKKRKRSKTEQLAKRSSEPNVVHYTALLRTFVPAADRCDDGRLLLNKDNTRVLRLLIERGVRLATACVSVERINNHLFDKKKGKLFSFSF
jgi:hypothetical protein